MLWYYINLMFRWISIYRWNNFPRIENVTETDNLAYVLHTIVIMKYMLEEKEKIKINLDFVFKKIILWSFVTFMLSDINSDLKQRIKQKNNIMYTKLELKVYNLILWINIPQRIKTDFENILQSDNTIFWTQFWFENKLIRFCKLRVAKQEALHNAMVYKNNYKKVIESMDEKLNNEEFAIFNKYMTKNIENYLENIRRLQFAQRWNKMRRIYPISVMSHLFIVFFLCYLIWTLEELKSEKITELMLRGLYHDISEAITWDVVTPTKKAINWLEDLLVEIETDMVEESLLIYIKKFKFQKDIKKFILDSKEWEIWKLLKIADIFSALFEAKVESHNNDEFLEIYRKTKKLLNSRDYTSVDYLMKFWVDYFDDNIEEILKMA